MALLDLSSDHRARTRFADGADTLDDVVQAAEHAGLTSVAIVDRVEARTDWVATYSRSVDRARARTAVRLYCGVAVDILSIDGDLDAPAALPGVEQVAVLSRRFPLPAGAWTAPQVRAGLATGLLHPRDVLDALVTGYVRALRRASERAQAVLARPFSLLPEAGLTEAQLDDGLLDTLARGCRDAGAVVEVNERLACPSPRVALALVNAGVRLAAASDAYRAHDVGRWEYARALAADLPAPTEAPDAAGALGA